MKWKCDVTTNTFRETPKNCISCLNEGRDFFFIYGDYAHAHICVDFHRTGSITESLKVLPFILF